jgi:hypothetical protein
VFQFDTKSAFKGLIVAGAAAAALFAIPAQAGTLTLNSATMNQSYTAQIQGPASPFTGGGLNVYEGPITFNVTDATGTHNITAFCVDLFDDIGLGPFSPGLKYQTDTLTTTRDTNGQHLGTVISATKLTQINKLLTLASGLELNMVANAANLAAIQGAIWEIENPGYNVTSHNGLDAITDNYITQSAITDPAMAGFLQTGVQTTIISAYDSNGNYHQAFAFAVPGGVPEPATWAMMIMGFGGVGAMLRKRRSAVAFA